MVVVSLTNQLLQHLTGSHATAQSKDVELYQVFQDANLDRGFTRFCYVFVINNGDNLQNKFIPGQDILHAKSYLHSCSRECNLFNIFYSKFPCYAT